MAKKNRTSASLRQDPTTGKWSISGIRHDSTNESVLIPAKFTYNNKTYEFEIPNSGTTIETDWETKIGEKIELSAITREYYAFIDEAENKKYIVSWDDNLDIVPGSIINYRIVFRHENKDINNLQMESADTKYVRVFYQTIIDETIQEKDITSAVTWSLSKEGFLIINNDTFKTEDEPWHEEAEIINASVSYGGKESVLEVDIKASDNFNVNKEALNFDWNESGKKHFNVINPYNHQYNIEISQESMLWTGFNPKSGCGSDAIEVWVSGNTSIQDRTHNIVVNRVDDGYGTGREIKVTQYGKDDFKAEIIESVGVNYIYFGKNSGDSGSGKIKITNPNNYDYSIIAPEWLNTGGTESEDGYIVSAKTNSNNIFDEERESNIVIKYETPVGLKEKTIACKQDYSEFEAFNADEEGNEFHFGWKKDELTGNLKIVNPNRRDWRFSSGNCEWISASKESGNTQSEIVVLTAERNYIEDQRVDTAYIYYSAITTSSTAVEKVCQLGLSQNYAQFSVSGPGIPPEDPAIIGYKRGQLPSYSIENDNNDEWRVLIKKNGIPVLASFWLQSTNNVSGDGFTLWTTKQNYEGEDRTADVFVYHTNNGKETLAEQFVVTQNKTPFTVSPTSLSFSSSGAGSMSLRIDTPSMSSQWSIDNLSRWVTVTPSSGIGPNNAITVTVTPQEYDAPARSVVLSAYCDDDEKTFTVSQVGGELTQSYKLIYSSITIQNNGTGQTIDVDGCGFSGDVSTVSKIDYLPIVNGKWLSNYTGTNDSTIILPNGPIEFKVPVSIVHEDPADAIKFNAKKIKSLPNDCNDAFLDVEIRKKTYQVPNMVDGGGQLNPIIDDGYITGFTLYIGRTSQIEIPKFKLSQIFGSGGTKVDIYVYFKFIFQYNNSNVSNDSNSTNTGTEIGEGTIPKDPVNDGDLTINP